MLSKTEEGSATTDPAYARCVRLRPTEEDEGSATTFVRWVGAATIVVSMTVAVSILARGVDLNPFIAGTVLLGLASGLLAASKGRALLPFVLLLLAAFPTIFGWYVFFYLPLLLLLIVGGVARSVTAKPRVGDGPAERVTGIEPA